MPQMAPISWLVLFLFFTFSYIMFLIMNYYNFFSTNKNLTNKSLMNNSTMKNKINLLNWKW